MFGKQLIGIAVLTIMSFGLCAGEVLFKAGSADDFFSHPCLSSADGIFTAKGNYCVFQSKQIMKFQPNKKYQFTGEYRAKAGTPLSRIYVGLAPLDAKRKRISAFSVNAVPQSETVLAKPTAKGSNVLYVKNASKWKIRDRYFRIAFNTKADYADLPNHNLAVLAVVQPVLEKGIWKVTLNQPMKTVYPAGTAVRLHRDGDTYLYAVSRLQASEKWQPFKGVVSGTPQKSGIRKTQLWPGTTQGRFLLMSLEGKKQTVVEFRNMKVEVLE